MSFSMQARCEIYRNVRTVFVRHFIDLGRLSIHVSSYFVNIHGSLSRLSGVETELTSALVGEIFEEVEQIAGSSRVNTDFDNWEQAGTFGPWHIKEGGDDTSKPSPTRETRADA